MSAYRAVARTDRDRVERGPGYDPERLRVDRAVDRAREGDREGIRVLYGRYSADVYRFVRSIVGNDHDAEDVTQTVFMKLILVIHRYRREAVPFDAWLIRVARNAAIDHLRERRPIPCEEIRTSAPDPFDGNGERLSDLKEAIGGCAAPAAGGDPHASGARTYPRRDRQPARQVGGGGSRPASPRPPRGPGPAQGARLGTRHPLRQARTSAARSVIRLSLI